MKLKSIQLKIVLLAGMCLFSSVAILVFFGLSETRSSQAYVKEHMAMLVDKSTEERLRTITAEQAGFIQSELQVNLDTARTLAITFAVLKKQWDAESGSGKSDIRQTINDILINVLKDNPKFLGTYTAWEPDAVDGRDKEYAGNKGGGYDETGRLIPYWNRDESGKIARQALVEYESQDKHPNGVRKGGWYLGPRETGKESVLDPFPYIVQGKQDWLTTLSVPVVVDGKFLGVAGTDLRLNFLQDLCKEVDKRIYDGKAEVVVISNLGLVVAHSKNPKLIGEHIKSFLPDNWNDVVKIIQSGQAIADMSNSTGMLRAFTPVTLGRTGKPWAVLVRVSPDVVMADANALNAALREKAQSSTMWQIGVGSSVAVVAILVTWFFSGSLARPIRKAAAYAGQVAKGDFSHQLDVQQGDEIGILANALRTMVDNLKEMIRQAEAKGQEAAKEAEKAKEAVAEAREARRQADLAQREGMLHAASKLEGVAAWLTTASGNLAVQIDQSNQGAMVQRNRAEETATAMNQMYATVLEVAKNASQATEGSGHAKDKAQDGAEIVRQVVDAIGNVQSQAARLKENMSALGERAEGIGQIMEVISDIADQTNLLALNAAIEAARAGDAGRGFAVVADEVRKLAEKTMSATSEVGNTVRAIQVGARANIESVDDAAKAIDQATDLAHRSGAALKEIVAIVDVASEQVRAIDIASNEQAAATELITKAVDEINSISTDTATTMKHSADAVDELAQKAQVLQGLVEELKRN